MSLIESYEAIPYWKLIGIKVDSVEENSARIKLNIHEDLLNGNDILHGGVVTSLLDAVMGINLKLNIGEASYATVSLTSQFLKAVKADETIFATAVPVQKGRSIACMEARLFNQNGDIIGMGIGTFKIRQPK
ncbi:PaaI family thioesterase [Mesobacillus maritimus]|uniref:PaaI family thioesterase n=1 Tax=Mesobacillus maritimus TaxID=1643336 RepID=UPI0020415380|nr:PaaI family thioesterase [Mesobacillus maritimus]MCM3587873.1 PaaI family thioesterase [Mesobacillus maritimus]